MRINEIAPGDKRNLRESQFEKIWDRLIIPNCKEILEMYVSSNALFYRGSSTRSSLVFRGSSRNDRRPRDSHLFFSELFELGLKELGMTALRSNSIFVTNKQMLANSFGEYTYIIFPIDGFEYTWTKHIDITLNNRLTFLHNWANSGVCDIIEHAWTKHLNNILKKPFDNGSKSWIYDGTVLNLFNDVKSNLLKINDILISNNYTPIEPNDLIDLDKFNNFFEPRNTGLLDMMYNSKVSAKETMIKGSYYAFDVPNYSYLIKDKLDDYNPKK